MLRRLKNTIVESYVGAIALGYLLAQCVLHVVGIFAAPVAGLISERQYREISPTAPVLPSIPYYLALPEAVRFVVLLLLWYFLFRWLYLTPAKPDLVEPTTDSR
ncbi:MAG TPA: hypothetical protein VIY69_16345 [Candidatus Acidoferrales bacterium]